MTERDRQTDRKRDGQTETATANIKRQRECGIVHRETETLLRRSNDQTDRDTASVTERNRQIDRQKDRQTERETDRQTETATANRKRQRECRTTHTRRKTEALLREGATIRQTGTLPRRRRETDRLRRTDGQIQGQQIERDRESVGQPTERQRHY